MSTHPFASAAEPDANSLPGEKASSAGDPGTGEKHTSIRHSRESGNPSSTDVLTGITAVVLTRNVAAEIAPCLAALAWAAVRVADGDEEPGVRRLLSERGVESERLLGRVGEPARRRTHSFLPLQ